MYLFYVAPPFNFFKISRWAWFFKGGRYLKEILILNSFSFEDKGKRFTRLKPGLALMLLSKGLFYIRDMAGSKEKKIEFDFFEATFEGGFFNFLWAFFFF